jgi:hypothetical protein
MHPLPGHRLGLRAPPATAGTGRKPVAAVRRGPVPGLQCLYRFGSAAHARWLQDRVRQRRLTPLSWSDESEDPIPGLRTLRDAAYHIQKLPKAQQKLRIHPVNTAGWRVAEPGRSNGMEQPFGS